MVFLKKTILFYFYLFFVRKSCPDMNFCRTKNVERIIEIKLLKLGTMFFGLDTASGYCNGFIFNVS